MRCPQPTRFRPKVPRLQPPPALWTLRHLLAARGPESADSVRGMASKLLQFQSKAVQASQFVAKHGGEYYKQILERNQQYVQHPPSVERCDELSKKLFYSRLASLPGRYESFWKELDSVKHMWKNRAEIKVEDAGVAALFGLELFAWFCAGEIVGRGFTLTGYHV